MMQHYVTEPDGYLEPKISPSGYGSIPAQTCIQAFQQTVAKHGDRPALYLKRKNSQVFIVIHPIDTFVIYNYCMHL